MNQCVPTSKTVITETLMMSKVANKAVPFFTKPNIEESKRQAVTKSAAWKNTQVTFTRKNVNNAFKKSREDLVLINAGAKEAVTVLILLSEVVNTDGCNSIGKLLLGLFRSC